MTRRRCIQSLSIGPALIGHDADATDDRLDIPKILQTPIPFSNKRMDLTLQYIRTHYDPKATDITIVPKVIVVHWTAGSTTESALATFAPDRVSPSRPELLRGGEVNVSTHFLVSQDGTIRQLMPMTPMARHVIGMNHISIGIENVGGSSLPLTEVQLVADTALIRYLATMLPSIRYLIGHQESNLFRGTPLWTELLKSYGSANIDPGLDFMTKIRKRLADLSLLSQYGR